MDIGERKLKILAAIVETFVETGEPVGSKALCEALDFSVSSATIRNEMAELVDMGLLEQPHTSAGRVPTHQGYRLYINRLMNRRAITEEEQQFIDGNLPHGAVDPEDLLEDASEVLAELTKLAAVSTTPLDEDATIRGVQFVQTGRRSALAVLMTSSGMIKNRQFRCDYDLTPEVLRVFYSLLNERLAGLPLSSLTPGFVQTMAASMGELTMLLPPVLVAVLEAARDAMAAEVRLEGQTNLLFLPEFEPETARRIMEFLNRRDELARLLNSQGASIRVLIGRENERPELSDSSVLIARYTMGGRDAGAIGLIGSTRMNYPKMIASLEYLATRVGKLLSELMDME
jgi:heat-inducible transcriptional repressor